MTNGTSALLAAAASAGTWAAWLSWESGYTTDAATGAVSGPYSVWQVAGCAVTFGAVSAWAGRRLHPLVVAPVMAVPFTVAWSAQAAANDDSGLWPVGAALVLFGTAAGAAAVAFASSRLKGSAGRKRSLT
jgi:hypothetical protein